MDLKKILNKEFLSIVFTSSYFFGFVLWNGFLNDYGFFEINVLQTRFISAGLVFLSPVILFIILSKKDLGYFFSKGYPVLILIIYFIVYLWYCFPSIPQSLGGARPFPVSIIGSPEQISYLNMFNLASAPDSKTQTIPVCQIYSDDVKTIVGISSPVIVEGKEQVSKRVLILHQSEVKGFQPMPAFLVSKTRNFFCEGFVRSWGKQ